MESIGPLLQAFYTQPLSPQQRASIHETLLNSLTDPDFHKSAIAYVTHIADSTAHPVDPFLLHHSLHTIETLARSSFSSIPPSDLTALQQLLLNLLTTAHLRHLSSQTLPTHRVPPHALNKAAAALVALSKRQWLAGTPNSFFPDVLFRLVDSSAHTPRSLASLLAGHALLTTLLDDALSQRRDLPAADAVRLRRLVATHANRFLATLEITQRAAGPTVPAHVAPSAARAVSSLAKLAPPIASDAAAMLARSALGRFDPVAPHILAAIVDVLYMPAAIVPAPVAHSVSSALEQLATGSRTRSDDARAAPSLLAVVDALIPRLVSRRSSVIINVNGSNSQNSNTSNEEDEMLTQVLNGLMGVSTRWATHRPAWLPRVLDSWMAVLEAFDDADRPDDPLLAQRVFPSVAALCAQRAFFASNEAVLSTLRMPKPTFFAVTKQTSSTSTGSTAQTDDQLRQWNELAETMAEVAVNPLGPSSAALFLNHSDADVTHEDDDDDDNDDDDDDNDNNTNDINDSANGHIDETNDPVGWASVSVLTYTTKCIETLAVIAQMSPAQARDAASVSCAALDRASDASTAALVDVHTAVALAHALAGAVQPVEAVALTQRVSSVVASGAWRAGRLGVIALRAAAVLSPALRDPSEEAVNIARQLVTVARSALTSSTTHSPRVSIAATWLIICINEVAQDALFSNAPPLGVDVITDAAPTTATGGSTVANPSVSLLAVASLVRWLAVPRRDAKGLRIRWSEDEWSARERKLAELCTSIFAPSSPTNSAALAVTTQEGRTDVSILRHAATLKTLMLAVHTEHGRAVDAVWRAAARDAVPHFVSVLSTIAQQISSAPAVRNSTRDKVAAATATAILRAVACTATVCSRCAAKDGMSPGRDAVRAALPLTSHPNLVGVPHAIMRVMRDRLAAGESEMLETGVDIAVSCLRQCNPSNKPSIINNSNSNNSNTSNININNNNNNISNTNNNTNNNATNLGAHNNSNSVDNDIEEEVCEMAVSLLSEALKRHWRIMWPNDTVPSDKPDRTASTLAPATAQHVYFKALTGIVDAMKSRVLTVCRSALLALQQLDASRRLYARAQAFRDVGAGRAVVAECLCILGGGGDSSRESLADEAVEVLWGTARADAPAFAAMLPHVVREITTGRIDDDAVAAVVKLFSNVEDNRSAFSRVALAAANDMVFYSSLRPSL